MNTTSFAAWLDTSMAAFDYSILKAVHDFTLSTGGILTHFFEAVSLLSEKGIPLLAAGLILFIIRKTRRTGLCITGAVCCSAFLTLVLKDLIARTRPFVDTAGPYHQWRLMLDLPADTGFAFPSGHTTVAMAAATAVFLCLDRRKSWTAFIFAGLTAFSRLALVAHYPSDIIGGLAAGAAGALVSYLCCQLLGKKAGVSG